MLYRVKFVYFLNIDNKGFAAKNWTKRIVYLEDIWHWKNLIFFFGKQPYDKESFRDGLCVFYVYFYAWRFKYAHVIKLLTT